MLLVFVVVMTVAVAGYDAPTTPQPNLSHTQYTATHTQHKYARSLKTTSRHDHNTSPRLGRRRYSAAEVKVFVDGGGRRESGVLHHFWRSTGLCPPAPHSNPQPFLLSQDEMLNLALVGSAPHQAFTQVRIHWLLDLINASLEQGVGEAITPVYNFSQLDTLMDHLYHRHLRPGFELMGNPGGIFTDLENDTQVLWWRDLVTQTAARYAGRYGLEWVGSWRWETWNEPDHHDFDNLNFTVQGFMNYYDACRAGLDAVWEGMVLGGPGGSCRDPGFSPICWALLTHCHQGASHFPPHTPPRIDFISIHKKGQEDADSILTEEVHTIRIIRRTFPRLRHVPVINDEGDFLKGWWRGVAWRADARYPAMVARAVATHLPLLTLMRYQLISFDNAFLNYRPSFFDQRTLVARFQMNSSHPVHVQMVKKWSYSVMGLLALLGHRLLPHYVTQHPDLSVISSCRNCDPAGGVVSSGAANEVDDGLLHLQLLARDPSIPIPTSTHVTLGSTPAAVPSTPVTEGSIIVAAPPTPVTEGSTTAAASPTPLLASTPEAASKPVSSSTPESRPFAFSPTSSPTIPTSIPTTETPTPVATNTTVPRSPVVPPSTPVSPSTSFTTTPGARNINTNLTNKESVGSSGGCGDDNCVGDNGGNDDSDDGGGDDANSVENRGNEGVSDEVNGVEYSGNDAGDGGYSDGSNGVTGDVSSWEATLLLTRSKGTTTSASSPVAVRIAVALPKRLVGEVVVAAVYRLGWGQKGPYEAWQEVGSPEEPTRPQLQYIRAYEGGRRAGPVGVVVMGPVLRVTLQLTLPDLHLLHLCHPHPATPGQVMGVRTVGVTYSDVLVTWSDEHITTRCILRYEVEHSAHSRGGPYRRVSGQAVTDNNFWYSLPQLPGSMTVEGWYRVRVVTYWGSVGPFSPPHYHRHQ